MIETLRDALAIKTNEASEKWAVFEAERERVARSNADISKNAPEVRRLSDLHDEYKALSDEAADLQQRLIKALDGGGGSFAVTGRDGLSSLGSEFLKHLGASGM